MITLTKEQEKALLESAKADFVRHLISTRGKELELLEAFEVSGILRLDRRTWEKSIPKVTISAGVYRYQMADVVKFIEDRKERKP
jgi:hypothetical protein